MASINRHRLAALLMLVAIGLTLVAGYQSHVRTAAIDEQQQLQFILWDSDHIPIVVIRDDGQVIVWNYAMRRLTGISKEQAQEQGMRSIICDPAYADRHDAALEKAFTQTPMDKVIMVDCEIWNAKHKKTPVQIAVRMARTDDDTRYAIAFLSPRRSVVKAGEAAQ